MKAVLSANLGFMWDDRPTLDRLGAAAAAGFEAVELQWPFETPAEAVRDTCAELGLRLLCLNTPLGDPSQGEFGLGAVAGREQAFRDGLDKAVKYARIAGAKSVHAMVGIVLPENMEPAWQVARENLAYAADRAGEAGLDIFLETINWRRRPNYFFTRLDQIAKMIGELDRNNIRMMFDVYHVAISEGDVINRLRQHFELIGHVQIAAVPSRAEPDEGEISFAAIFAELDRLNYCGYIGCEYEPRQSTDAGLTWIQALGARTRSA